MRTPLFLLAALAPPLLAQPSGTSPLDPPANGPRRAGSNWTAIEHATVHAKPGSTFEGVVVFRDGIITHVVEQADWNKAAIAPGAQSVDAKGLHLYPAFIDPYVEVDAPAPKGREQGRGKGASAHWNPRVTPQRSALDGDGLSEAAMKELRELGFAAACISPKGGVFRGSSAVVSLVKDPAEQSAARVRAVREKVYHSLAFDLSGGGYPNSQMGAIALMRQTLMDAAWKQGMKPDERTPNAPDSPDALDALDPATPLLISVDNAQEWLRGAKIAAEAQRSAIILASGSEFTRLPAVAATKLPALLPLNYPKAPDVSSPGKAETVELATMMMWEQAPTNPRRLWAAGVSFALTTAKLKNKADFRKHLRMAIAHGLPEERALAALTTIPAAMLGVESSLGTIEKGKRASLLLTTGPVFSSKTDYRSIYIDGVEHELKPAPTGLEGAWSVQTADPNAAKNAQRTLVFDKDGGLSVQRQRPSEVDGEKAGEEKSVRATNVVVTAGTLAFAFDHEPLNEGPEKEKLPTGVFLMSAAIERDASGRPVKLVGQGVRDTGEGFAWSAVRKNPPIAGDWPIFLQTDDPARRALGVLRIAENPALAASVVTFTDRGAESVAPVANLAWDGTTLWFDHAGATYRGAFDHAAKPPALRGDRTAGAEKIPFTARKLADAEKWWVGTWTVVRVDGKPEPIDDQSDDKVRLLFEEKKLTVVFVKPGKEDVRIEAKDLKIDGNTITFTHDLAPLGMEGVSTDTITRFAGELRGVGKLPDGSTHTYAARLDVEEKEEETEELKLARRAKDVPELLPTPLGPYGLERYPDAGTVHIDGATIWTNTDAGIIPKGYVVLSAGKITFVADSPPPGGLPPGALVINAEGKHLTPGIIDAHSHTGISRGVNESGQAVTAEVRIQDVTDADDVDWYRQLAGGVTSVLQLHGSANAIGGQSQTTKLRWGCLSPDDMHFEGAIPGIKFALGENPRQVNWQPGDDHSRYPHSRMGVEMLIRDRFIAAKEYASRSEGARRDLELEALAQVLAGERLVHCHSYRQDEILMLAKVAGQFNFKIGTYQHILEGYKVADVVRDFSGGGSGFADWWAYKVEVQDAIPHGLPLMQLAGATTSFNSDSNELARRLNTEAAKAVKYGEALGGISPQLALKFVTLHPAKQLRIDDRVGTIQVGKDADVVVWSGDPLSTLTKAEHTFVDGRHLFSLEMDAQHRRTIAGERQRLIQKLLKESKKDKKLDAQKPESKDKPGQSEGFSEQERLDAMHAHEVMMRSGRDPRFAPGVCGCGVRH